MRHVSSVTVAARKAHVRSVQREVRKFVIKTLFVKVDNVFVTALVITMTTRAVELLRLRKLAVEARLLCYVGTHLRVADHTQFALWLVRQRRMAGPAICLNVRVTGDDGSGHDQPLLDIRGMGRLLLRHDRQHKQCANDQAKQVRKAALHQ